MTDLVWARRIAMCASGISEPLSVFAAAGFLLSVDGGKREEIVVGQAKVGLDCKAGFGVF